MVTGSWGKKAANEAKKFCQVNIAADASDRNFTYIPAESSWQRSDNAAYLHYTPNETIAGVEFHFVPGGDVPLVADMSSTILSRPIDVSRFGVIYAGAQKNIGPAGLTLVIVRDDLISQDLPESVPSMFRYATHAENGSMYNTPPTYGWYLAGLVFQWLKELGGLEGMAEINARKAKLLYDAIDNSSFYENPVEVRNRSWMNVPFTLVNPELDAEFLAEAEKAGLSTLKGHRSVGGIRTSIYNAMEPSDVARFVEFAESFARGNR